MKANTGLGALREIKKYQSTGDYILPRLSFKRLCRELLQNIVDYNHNNITGLHAPRVGRMTADAYEALQADTESYVVSFLGGEWNSG